MAVLAIFHAPGMTKAMYDKIRAELDARTPIPDGAVFHAAGTDAAGGIRVADIWESEEALQAFIDGTLGPSFVKLGYDPPQTEIYPVHLAISFAPADSIRRTRPGL